MVRIIELFHAPFFVEYIGLWVTLGIVGYSIGGIWGAVIGFNAPLSALADSDCDDCERCTQTHVQFVFRFFDEYIFRNERRHRRT